VQSPLTGAFAFVPVKTSIYIDGFNLYYGSFKENPLCKWLDLHALFTRILKPHHEINCINYFTANISARNGEAGAPVGKLHQANLIQKERFNAPFERNTVNI
jgi:hypothetical protein